MSYRVADAKDVEPWRGTLRRMRRALGIASFGVNQLELPPDDAEEHPEHDETETGHDELYVCIDGAGAILVDGERVDLRPGRYVYVTPESRRKVLAGGEGIRCLVVGVPAATNRGGWDEL